MIFYNNVDLCGHRGARGLAPEHTLPGYDVALAMGVDTVDMDVGMTKEGILVATHDVALNPNITRDQQGQWVTRQDLYIKNLTLMQLKTYDVGRIKPDTHYARLFPDQKPVDRTPIPTVKEVIQYVKKYTSKRVKFQFEIKTHPQHPEWTFSPEIIAAALVKLIEEEQIVDRAIIQAFDYRCLLAVQKINPDIATAYVTAYEEEKNWYSSDVKIASLWTAGHLLQQYDGSMAKMIKALGGCRWDAEDVQLTPERVKEAHELGLKIGVWSYPEHTGKEFDQAMIEKLMAMGVDSIITDRPDKITR